MVAEKLRLTGMELGAEDLAYADQTERDHQALLAVA
jgi:hypothetical protein